VSKLAKADSFFQHIFFLSFIAALTFLLANWWEFPLVDYRFGIGLSKTNGVILESRVAQVTIRRPKGDLQEWRAFVRYQYTVDGVTYKSDRIEVIRPVVVFVSGQANNLEHEDNLHMKYRVGRAVPVYYNAQNPSFALLERGYPLSRVVENLVMIGLLSVGFGLLLRHRRKRHKELAPKRIIPQNLDDLK
jgi:hypothetical protein